jgi:site-specific DNA-methyltransferase (adenine-specific)
MAEIKPCPFEIQQGDCLELMKDIPNGSVDMILCDLPYGTTACKWDTVIPFEPLWEQYNRIIKDNGAIVLFGSEPFSTELRHSNLKMFRYDWIWDKKIPSGMSYARFQPMRQTENISVFCKSKTVYNPIMVKRYKPIKAGGNKYSPTSPIQACKESKDFQKTYEYKNPVNILTFDRVRRGNVHPTQKPVALLEYLIKTYTNEGEVVLDNCMGSGSTGIACINTNRKFIGFELDEDYFEIAKKRIEEAWNRRVDNGDK